MREVVSKVGKMSLMKSGLVSRRAFLGGVAGMGALAPLAAMAQESPLEALLRANAGRRSQERFDSGTAAQADLIRSSAPILSAETVANTESVLALYGDVVSRGGWPRVPDTKVLKIGARNPAVPILRQRLVMAGDMPQDRQGYPDTFDSYVDAGVRRFQIRHGLTPTGVMDRISFDVMNVPAEIRLRQLETNLVRLRAMSGFLGDRFVFVNIPGAEMEIVEAGRVVARHNAVVGKIDRQTPVLTSKINVINFNPYWHVPVSIIRKDLIPKMQANPNYLAENHIRILDGKGREIAPETINWDTSQALQYQFRQDPGDDNAMARIKISFPNQYDVYMHDTPFKDLFGDNDRFYSSGCMRIQNVREVVTWLLRDTPNWGPDAIDNAIETGARIDAKLKTQVPVYTNYVTAWGTQGGVVHFRDDIYSRDGIGELAALQSPSDVQ